MSTSSRVTRASTRGAADFVAGAVCPAAREQASALSRTALGKALLDELLDDASVSRVAALLDQGAPVDYEHKLRSGNTVRPLFVATFDGKLDVARLLLSRGADPNCVSVSEDSQTPLHCAAWLAFSPPDDVRGIVTALLDAGADADCEDANGLTPLLVAAKRNCVAAAEVLLTKVARGVTGRSALSKALHYAAKTGAGDVVSLLLAHGATVDWTSKEGCTSVHVAARGGHDAVLNTLLSSVSRARRRALVRAADASRHECTPLHHAAMSGHAPTVRHLVTHGADVDALDAHGYTPLACAVHVGSVDTLNELLACGACISTFNPHGWTLLHIAAEKDSSSIMDALAAHPIPPGSPALDVHALDEGKFTPLHVAAGGWGTCRVSSIAWLLAHGADARLQNINGRTPLHIAAARGCLDACRLLFDACPGGLDIKDQWKVTPCEAAARAGHRSLVTALRGWADRDADARSAAKRVRRGG